MKKLYEQRDIEALDDAGNYYINHVSAMTKEGLCSKSDIAAELGYRDSRIDELQTQVEMLADELRSASRYVGFLSVHLRGRLTEAALLDIAKRAESMWEASQQGGTA